VLFLLILGLGYMAWRGMQNSQMSHGVSAPPPVAAQQAPPEATGQDQPAATKSDAPDLAANKPPTDNRSATEAAAKEPAKAAADEPAKEAPAPPHSTPKAAPASATTKSAASENSDRRLAPNPPADRWGTEELAVAQRYLNGANGQRRDTAEAAKWLWKSIAKHNGQATLLLADLYLKGNGVPKNCDQARILLDSAARKGISGAGERLRNLPAFGCQ
jgi:TPR repeat protein